MCPHKACLLNIFQGSQSSETGPLNDLKYILCQMITLKGQHNMAKSSLLAKVDDFQLYTFCRGTKVAYDLPSYHMYI
jgi:hypothetical protein